MRMIAMRLALILGLIAPIDAAAIDASALEAELAAALDALAGGDDPALAYDGVAVRSDGPGFAVTIDGLRLAPDAEGYLDLGTVGLHVTPRGDDLLAFRDLRLPAEIRYRGADDAVEAVLRTASATAAGLWSIRLQNFLAAEGAINSLTLTDAAGATILSTGAVHFTVDSEETAPGHWNREAAFALQDLQIADETTLLSIGSITSRSEAIGLTPLSFRDVFGDLQPARDATDPVQDWEIEALFRAEDLMPDGSGWFELRDLSVRDAAGVGILSLAQVKLDIANAGFAGDQATLTLALRHDGLALGPAFADDHSLADALLPHHMRIDAGFEDLPGRDLVRALVALMLTGGGDDGDPDLATGFGETIQRLLLEAGSKLRLSSARMETDIARVAAEGLLQAHPGAAHEVVAAINLEIDGLDTLIDRLAEAPADSGAVEPWLLLQTLRALGEAVPAAGDATRYRYAIALSPDGAFLLNGKDLRFLLPGPHLQEN